MPPQSACPARRCDAAAARWGFGRFGEGVGFLGGFERVLDRLAKLYSGGG